MNAARASLLLVLAAGCVGDGNDLDHGDGAPAACPVPAERSHYLSLGVPRSVAGFDEALALGLVPRARSFDPDAYLEDRGLPVPPGCCDDAVCLHADLGMVWEADAPHYAVQVGVSLVPPADQPPGVDLVVVLDISASLRGTSAARAMQDSLLALIDGMAPTDRIALVTFRGNVMLPVPFGTVAERRDTFRNEVEELEFGGASALAPALLAGLDLGDQRRDRTRQSRLFILTDGVPTWGTRVPADIVRDARPYVVGGTLVTAFVIGEETTDEVLRGVMTGLDGRLHEVLDTADAPAMLLAELADAPRPVMRDLSLMITFEDGFSVQRVYGVTDRTIDREAIHIERESVLALAEGTSAPGHGSPGAASALIDLLEPASASSVARVTLSYRIDMETRTLEHQLSIPFAPRAPRTVSWFSNPAIAHNMLRRDVALALEQALAAADRGSLTEAARLAAGIAARIDDFRKTRSGALERDAETVQLLLDAIEARGFTPGEQWSPPEDAWPGP